MSKPPTIRINPGDVAPGGFRLPSHAKPQDVPAPPGHGRLLAEHAHVAVSEDQNAVVMCIQMIKNLQIQVTALGNVMIRRGLVTEQELTDELVRVQDEIDSEVQSAMGAILRPTPPHSHTNNDPRRG